jgi:D-alanine--poly(phosphoribitol) ligase subunit 2
VTNSKDFHGPIRELFRDVLALEVPFLDTDLIETGLLDSLALVELLFEIERQFKIDLQLDELDIENFRTIERICEFVALRRGISTSSGAEDMGRDWNAAV